MIVTTYKNGDLLVPRRAEGDAIGDGLERIGPEHPDYMKWQDAIDREAVDTAPGDETEIHVEEHGELGPVLIETPKREQ